MCVYKCARVRVRVCVCVCAHASVCASVRARVHVRRYIRMPAHIKRRRAFLSVVCAKDAQLIFLSLLI